MLVLSRKQRQEIVIGEEVRVCVLSIRGGVVKLGIEAPASVLVKRSELGRTDRPGAGDSGAAGRAA